MSWDADPQVASPVGRPIAELLEPRPRRQRLDGFEPVYSDIVDYIIRCTHRIWEQKDIGLCRTHYSADCPVLTMGGLTTGVQGVVQNTVTTISGYADRSPVAEDVVWSEDAPGVFLSSHRIVSYASHHGPDLAWGPVTGLRRGVRVIADCLCRENLIVEEWLARDNLQLVRELGYDPETVAARQAQADREGDPARHAWRAEALAHARETASVPAPDDHPAAPIVAALDLAFNRDLYGQASAICSPSVEAHWPSGRRAFGRGGWIGLLIQLGAGLTDRRWRLDHIAARPLPGGEVAVALRWYLTGRHGAGGVWGAPSGRDVWLMAMSHYRLRGGRVLEDVTVFDELSLLRQIAGGLGA